MKNLKRSKIAKVIAFILFALTVTTTIGNIVLLVLLNESNVRYADKEQYETILYSKIADRSADNLQHYLYWVLLEDQDNNTEYNNKLDLYKKKYSAENCNFSFIITDKDGKVILTNYKSSDPEYTFTKSIFNEYSYYPDEITDNGNEVNEPETTTVKEGETANSSEVTVTQAQTEASISVVPTYSDITAPSELTVTERAEKNYVVDKSDDSYPYKFCYTYYGKVYNQKILDFCLKYYNEEAMNLNIETCPYATYTNNLWMRFNEEDFAVSENGVVYYKNDIYENETTGFDDEYVSPVVVYETYTVKIMLPKEFTAKDIYYYAQKFTNVSHAYITHIVMWTVVLSILSVAILIFIILSAGYTKRDEQPTAHGLHKIPGDIMLAIFTAVAFFFIVVCDQISYHYDFIFQFMMLPFIAAAAMLLLFIVETIAVRIKTKTLLKNLVVIYIAKIIIKLVKRASQNINLLWKLGIVYVAVSLAELICSIIMVTSRGDCDALIILLIIVKLLEIPAVLLFAINFATVQNGAKKLSHGDFSEKVASKYLFGEFKKNAEYLNSITEGVNNEINERMKSEKMKTELITNVSHDLKTPLTSIINYIDLLKGANITDTEALKYIEVIDRQSQRLKKLTSDIVDASKAATGNIDIQRENTILNVLLEQVAGEYNERLQEKCLSLVCNIPDEDIVISADGKLLWRVFDNLMNNICKYALGGTRVYLSISKTDNSVALVFRNISGDKLNITPAELTERFVRGDQSRNTEGSGLGLSIAKSLTELMNGKFDVVIDGDLFKVTLIFKTID